MLTWVSGNVELSAGGRSYTSLYYFITNLRWNQAEAAHTEMSVSVCFYPPEEVQDLFLPVCSACDNDPAGWQKLKFKEEGH